MQRNMAQPGQQAQRAANPSQAANTATASRLGAAFSAGRFWTRSGCVIEPFRYWWRYGGHDQHHFDAGHYRVCACGFCCGAFPADSVNRIRMPMPAAIRKPATIIRPRLKSVPVCRASFREVQVRKPVHRTMIHGVFRLILMCRRF